jgi:quinol monooxygenase YgiN
LYAQTGKLPAQAGKRAQLCELLLRAAARVGQLPGCRMYAVCEDLADENAVWVMELWDDQDAHDASLGDEQVRALIAEARPLLGGAPEGTALRVLGGWGV